MGTRTLCPIKDIKGWHNYNKCPYTKSLFSKAGVSEVLHTSGRKERFFSALQKNVGRDGYLTKDAMKKTLGEFKHEVDSNQFYKLSAAILPEEEQRFSTGNENASFAAKTGECPASSGKPADDSPASVAHLSKNRKMECPVKIFHPGAEAKKSEGRSDSDKSGFSRALSATMRNK